MSTPAYDSAISDASSEIEDDETSGLQETSGVHPIAPYAGEELAADDEFEPERARSARRGRTPSRSWEQQALPRSMQGVVGISESLTEVYRIVDRVADTNCNIMITGHSGTGKESVARAVHRTSRRANAPFVVMDCGALPDALLESGLFGDGAMAYAGAEQTKPGCIALAQGGTLFLDEIGELPLALQVRLLRVLQSHEYAHDDTRAARADVRIIAATHVNLETAMQSGAFREDLYYRLNVIHLTLPSLRERPEDVPLLVQHFIARSKEKLGRSQVTGVSRAAAQLLAEYHWPGNVGELENTIERAVLLCDGQLIEPKDLPQRVLGLGSEKRITARLPESGLDLRSAVDTFENQLIRQALERTNWNKKQAANLLGLNRTTLVEMLKRKRITRAA
jgi:transcriptional regulator with PAS, ATPase and Fis domain